MNKYFIANFKTDFLGSLITRLINFRLTITQAIGKRNVIYSNIALIAQSDNCCQNNLQ